MSGSPLVTNMMAAVQASQVAKGAPTMYGPDLEYLLVAALTELSTDPLVPADAQTVFTAQVALAQPDAAP